VRLKIDNLKKGSYFVFHDSPAFHTTGSFLMIKKKGTIVYSCQTYLVTLVNAEKQDARFKEVAGLIDILTKYK
jgi:phage gp45-like